MELKDRIQNIKTLLSYCPKASDEVMINNEVCTKFFGKFFSSQPNRFKKPEFDECRVQIELISILDKDVRTKHYTVGLQYCYNWDREGEDWTLYYFNDPECYYREWQHPELEYSEIPDYIWEIIQDVLFKKATERVNKDVESAYQTLEYVRNKRDEFYTSLKLNY